MSTITVDEVLRVIESTPTITIPEVAASRPPTVAVLEEIIATIRTELGLQSPNVVTLHALMVEMQTTQARLMEQAAKEIRETGQTTQLGKTPEKIAETVAKIRRMTGEVAAGSQAIALRLAQGIESPADTLPIDVVDNEATPGDDEKMSATTDKDYIDAKLAAATAQMIGDIKTANAIADGRLATIEARTDGRIASIEEKMIANFARFDATLHKSTADTVKWVAGTVLALGVIGISLMTFLLNNVAPKGPAAAPAPIIIYAQPTPAAPTTPQAPTAKP
ncbi:hypothetical protein [Janthinobacterium sp. UMAB-56]|uniref:hypothetical protein n=1 Tax=Janthinobacterium sp. UMAB-56 TaxID=1365361 RepID=UPI001C587D68|nr:hypothetical protein [Janthinobacterium sp. UMAB-56]